MAVSANASFFIFLIYLLAASFISQHHTADALSMPGTGTTANAKTKKNKILCVGIATLDTIATLDEYPAPDEKAREQSVNALSSLLSL